MDLMRQKWAELQVLYLVNTRYCFTTQLVNTIPTGRHDGGSNILLGGFSVAGTITFIRIGGKINTAKYSVFLKENCITPESMESSSDTFPLIRWCLRGSFRRNGIKV